MLFAGLPFLFYFLPIVMMVYFIVPGKCKNMVLLLGSFIFYAWGEPKYVLLMSAEILFTYGMGLLLGKYKGNEKRRNIITALSVVALLLALAYFKYADFMIGNFNLVAKYIQPKWERELLQIALPIGISFYTFQSISYLVDVARGGAKPQKNLLYLATYISLFPQLIAGPIVRYTQVEEELAHRKSSFDDMGEGMKRFLYGLGKKVLLANTLGELVSLYEESGALATNGVAQVQGVTVLMAWMYALAVSLQIYFDFSGYSDMAIGLGRVLGFHFPENFDYPFISSSVTEFWRRWHMTLGSWFRDYLYIPLGGNRCGAIKHIRNILVVWLATGLWHGASWNYVVWGLYFGVFLILEKYGKKLLQGGQETKHREAEKQCEVQCGAEKSGKMLCDVEKINVVQWIGRLGKHIYLCIVIVISFLIFHMDTFILAKEVLAQMFGLRQLPLADATSIYYGRSYLLLLFFAVVGATSLPKRIVQRCMEGELGFLVMKCGEVIWLAGILIVSVACLVNGSYNPFLYFRF